MRNSVWHPIWGSVRDRAVDALCTDLKTKGWRRRLNSVIVMTPSTQRESKPVASTLLHTLYWLLSAVPKWLYFLRPYSQACWLQWIYLSILTWYAFILQSPPLLLKICQDDAVKKAQSWYASHLCFHHWGENSWLQESLGWVSSWVSTLCRLLNMWESKKLRPPQPPHGNRGHG